MPRAGAPISTHWPRSNVGSRITGRSTSNIGPKVAGGWTSNIGSRITVRSKITVRPKFTGGLMSNIGSKSDVRVPGEPVRPA